MTAKAGEIRAHDRVSPASQTFTHINGANTELELWIGGPLGKLHLPIEVQLLTPGATYCLIYNTTDKDDVVRSDEIAVPAGYTAPIVLKSCPHRLDAGSTDGALLLCRY